MQHEAATRAERAGALEIMERVRITDPRAALSTCTRSELSAACASES